VPRPSGFVEPCAPSKVTRPPSGPNWVHEIKHDGYRLIVRKVGDRVRLFTRRGYDPWRSPELTRLCSRGLTHHEVIGGLA
jgi:bifunctional non-homologous end joining protein LigD